MENIMDSNKDSDVTIFLGDFQVSKLAQQELASRFDYCIQGNNDYPGISDRNLLFELDGVKIFATHGERYFSITEYVKKSKVAADAKGHGASLALHGHDHKASISEHDGVIVFNPGSPSYPRFGSQPAYGIIIIENGEIKSIENIIV